MLIPVFSGNLHTQAICDELRNHGLLVVETSRTHAKHVATEVERALGINIDSEGGPLLIHLSTEVDDRGWSEFLIYSEEYEYDYDPDKTQEMVRLAVRSWVRAGTPDIHYAKVCI